MIRFLFNQTILLILPILFFSSCGNQEEEYSPPNIIFIMSDDHARRATSCYTNEIMQTPNIDRIAQQGLQFDQAFVTNSICGPSRAVFLTGKHSHNNGFMSNFDQFDGGQATLPKYLQEAGYYTAVMGKWHLKSRPEGFDEYNILLDQGEYYNPTFTNGTDTSDIIGYSAQIITDNAIDVLQREKGNGKPIFLMVNHKAPHRNWMPDTTSLQTGAEKVFPIPSSFYDDYSTRASSARSQDMEIENMFLGFDLKMKLTGGQEEETGTGGDPRAPSYKWWNEHYDRMTEREKTIWDAYYNPLIEDFYQTNRNNKELLEWKYQRYMNDYSKSVQAVDNEIGKLLDYLEENNLHENTVVIYTSDQGFFLGEHGWYDKRFMYEPSLAIPLVMQYPKRFKNKRKKAKRIQQMVQNIDLAPTILELANCQIPSDMQGISLASFFGKKNQDIVKNWRKNIYYHYYQKGIWHFVEPHLGIRTNRYKLIYFYDIDEWELFDLRQDPEELENLYSSQPHQNLVDSMKSELRLLIKEVNDTTAVVF